jgi:TonB family protein
MSTIPKSWKFRPFTLGTQALPVCAMTELVYPNDAKAIEKLPFPLPPMPKELLFVPSETLGERVTGEKFITPNDEDKTRIQRSRVVRIIGSYLFCVDEAGKVDSVRMIRSTGVPNYDAKVMRGMQQWSYHPYVDDGTSVGLCSAVTFIYSQR